MSQQQTTDEEENESPQQVRATFILLAFAATLLLLPPRQWVSAIMMGVVTLTLGIRWRADFLAWYEGAWRKEEKRLAGLLGVPVPGEAATSDAPEASEPERTSEPSP